MKRLLLLLLALLPLTAVHGQTITIPNTAQPCTLVPIEVETSARWTKVYVSQSWDTYVPVYQLASPVPFMPEGATTTSRNGQFFGFIAQSGKYKIEIDLFDLETGPNKFVRYVTVSAPSPDTPPPDTPPTIREHFKQWTRRNINLIPPESLSARVALIEAYQSIIRDEASLPTLEQFSGEMHIRAQRALGMHYVPWLQFRLAFQTECIAKGATREDAVEVLYGVIEGLK